MVALADAIDGLLKKKVIAKNPLVQNVAAVSVGVCDGVPTLDLDYIHDSTAEVDLNVIMTDRGKFVELQGCAEHKAFSDKDLAAMLKLAKKGLKELFALQKKALKR
jgi:ribonuclease PH